MAPISTIPGSLDHSTLDGAWSTAMASELYSSLERLLLFRRLHLFENEEPSFTQVSEALKHDEILRSSDSFDLARLEPDALQAVYLRTLKEEAKAQIRGDQNDQTPQSLRKRKLSSPPLETLEEAAQYTHLLPQLVDRLYFHYQRDAVEEIKKEERKYYSLKEKIRDVEREEWEGRQQIPESSSRPTSHGVPSIQTLLRHEEEKGAQDSSGRPQSFQNGAYYQDSSQSMANGVPPARSSVGPEARLPSSDPRQTQPGGYTGVATENGPPYLPPPQHPSQSYSLPTPGQDAHRRRSSQPVPSPSPRMSQGSIPPPERSSASPIILPPVSGMLRSQGNSAGPLDPVSENSQPYRPGSNMSPRSGQTALARPHSNQLPQNRNYAQPTYSYHDSPQYPTYHPYSQHGYYPQYPGPGTNVPPGNPYGTSTGYPSPGPSHPSQHPAYYPQGYYNQSPMSTSYPQQQPPRYMGLQTPIPDGIGRTFQPASVKTSTSSTKWKNVDLGRGIKPPGSPTRPLSREVSPISNRGDSPEQDTTPAQRHGAGNQEKGGTSTKTAKPASRRSRLSRGVGRGAGAGSASASARDRTRSQSVASHADELSIDAKASATQRIKPEPSLASAHEDETSTMDESSRKPGRRRRGTIKDDDPPATPRTAIKRKRGNSDLPPLSPALAINLGAVPLMPRATVIKRPGYVLATRNLQKTSSTLMQTVTGHKDAYLFAKPLTERDAPGYDKLIFRPQDFKAIKAALAAGSRAVAAIIEEAGEEISAGAKSIWIPETEEVVPPKGIVNSAQLEKELLRIFANAVMFNPELAENRGLGPAFRTRAKTLEEHESGSHEDEDAEAARFEIGVARPVDGAVVKDTRKMCADVEEAFDEWRGIGKVDDTEARDAPVIAQPRDEVKENNEEGGGHEEEGAADEAANNGVGAEKEASEEPRPKRRRRQL